MQIGVVTRCDEFGMLCVQTQHVLHQRARVLADRDEDEQILLCGPQIVVEAEKAAETDSGSRTGVLIWRVIGQPGTASQA